MSIEPMNIEPDFTYLETELEENGITNVKVERYNEDRDGTPIPMLKFTRGPLVFTMNAEAAGYVDEKTLINELCTHLADDRVKEVEIAKWLADEKICAAAKCTVHGDKTYISYGNQHVCHPTSIFGPDCQEVDRRMLRLEFKDVNEQLEPGYARFMPAWGSDQKQELYDRFGVPHGKNYVIYYKRLDRPEPTLVLTFSHNLKSEVCQDGKLVTDSAVSKKINETVGPLPGGELVLTGIYVPNHPGEDDNILREFVFLGNVLASYGVLCVVNPEKYTISCENWELTGLLNALVIARWNCNTAIRGWLRCIKEGAESARGFYTSDPGCSAAPIIATPYRTFCDDLFEMFPFRNFVVPATRESANTLCPHYLDHPQNMQEMQEECGRLRQLCEEPRAYCRISLANLPNGSQEEVLTVARVTMLYSCNKVDRLAGVGPDKVSATYMISPAEGKLEKIVVDYDMVDTRLMFSCETAAKLAEREFKDRLLLDILSLGEIPKQTETTGRKTVTVSLPPAMHDYVKTQGSTAGSVSAYIQCLVEHDISTGTEYREMDEMTKTVIQKFMDLAEKEHSVYWSAFKVRNDWIQLLFDNRSEFPKLLVAFQDLSVSDTGIPVEVTWSLDMSPNDNVSRKILYKPEDGKWMQEQAKRLLAKYKAWTAKTLAKTMTDYRNMKK